MLMKELNKIKSIDPNLDTFNDIYSRKQPMYDLRGQTASTKLRRKLNEIDILMEIL